MEQSIIYYFKPWPNQDLHIPLGLLSGVDQPAASVLLSFSKLPNMGRSTFYKSPSTKLRNQHRLTSYLKGKVLTSLVVTAQIPNSRKTQLTKSSVSQTSYPATLNLVLSVRSISVSGTSTIPFLIQS